MAQDLVDAPVPLDHLIAHDAQVLSAQLTSIRQRLFPPAAQKTLRHSRAARRPHSSASATPTCGSFPRRRGARAGEDPRGTALLPLEQINDIRRALQSAKSREYVPRRQGVEHLQVLAVTNFKGGSGKTTTAAHLSQYLALRGYCVLRSTSTRSPACPRSSGISRKPTWEKTKPSTAPCDMMTDDDLCESRQANLLRGPRHRSGNLELQEFEHETPRMLARQRRSGQEVFFARIASVIQSVAETYDVVVIDCPPQLGFRLSARFVPLRVSWSRFTRKCWTSPRCPSFF